MKIFHCDRCEGLVYFENTQCFGCGSRLAFLPDVADLGSVEPTDDGTWLRKGIKYRLCANYAGHGVCNWAVPESDPEPFCRSCRLNRVIPDLSVPGNLNAWAKLEIAKRRLVYSLLQLGLPVDSKEEHFGGLAFEFLADDSPGKPILTGHANGVITLNIAEADDTERERRRVSLNEPYRTLLGHFRHEVGHYYWDLLVSESPRLAAFRQLFGDERASYADALKRYYEQGPAVNWNDRFISAYASCHPWEDWAETWAHYLHMTDSIETSLACGLTLRPRRADEPKLEPGKIAGTSSFDRLMEAWYPLTHLMNILNRGLGLQDGYPFVIPPAAVEKLRFVHETIHPEEAVASQGASTASL